MEKTSNGLFGLGFLVGAINYVATTVHFFSNEKVGLGWAQLLIPPAEFVLPWVASPAFGIASLTSLVLMIAGSSAGSGK
jgi:hypothetical protein